MRGLHGAIKTWIALSQTATSNAFTVTHNNTLVSIQVGGGVRATEVKFCPETGEIVVMTRPNTPAPNNSRYTVPENIVTIVDDILATDTDVLDDPWDARVTSRHRGLVPPVTQTYTPITIPVPAGTRITDPMLSTIRT